MIGDLRHVVTFQQKIETNDGLGGKSFAWKDLAQHPLDYAAIRQAAPGESRRYQRNTADMNAVLTLRFRDDLTTDMRVLIDDRAYEISGIADPDGRRRMIEIYCFASSGISV